MKKQPNNRSLKLVLVILLGLIGLAVLLWFMESFLTLLERVQSLPGWQAVLLAVLLLFFIGAFSLFAFRLLRGGRQNPKPRDAIALSHAELGEKLTEARNKGVDTAEAEAELARRSDESATLEVAIFGEVSAGKSAIVNALLPEQAIASSPLAGSTANANRYGWVSDTGAAIELIDLPGISGVEQPAQAIIDQALRSHLVLYVCDADLTQSDAEALQRLIAIDKPLVVVLNKVDQYTTTELEQIVQRLHERILSLGESLDVTIAAVIAGGREQIIELTSDGEEKKTSRVRASDIDQLIVALNYMIKTHYQRLVQHRKHALFYLASEQLARAESAFRTRRAGEVIRSHTKKAVVGALAAVSPGSDIVIQGYIGHSLVKKLSALYELTLSDVDIDKLLDLSQSRLGKTTPLALAVAGNGLKAFPGIGTVSGGLVHAVAYGLIFDAIGHSLARSLEENHEIDPMKLADALSASLEEDLGHRVGKIARIALSHLGSS